MSGQTILSHRRRGVTLLATVVTMPLMLGFVGLAVDVGMSRSLQADLRRTADSAALAAVLDLSGVDRAASMSLAQATVLAYVQKNPVFDNTPVHVDPLVDIVFGRGRLRDDGTGKVDFQPDLQAPDGVQVTVHATLGYTFARVLGLGERDLSATATAVLLPRDISVVIDLSGSMKHDSYLRFYDQTQINARDMWCSLDGPSPSSSYTPGAGDETEYANDTGPTIGIMGNWGDPIVPASYDATTDPGLWYLPRGQATSNPTILASLQARGYSSGEMGKITSATNDTTEWRNRTAVMIGLAEWNSSSSSDSSVGSGELTWLPYPSYRINWQWTDYLNWSAESQSKLAKVHPQFRYRFGLKTYVDFLLDRKGNHSQTDLTMTPEEPLQAVKSAVQALIDTVGQIDNVSLETFGSTGRHEVDLSANRQLVADTLNARQANHWDNSTNIGGGLQLAVDELASARGRSTARRIIVLMSDGANKTGPDPLSVAEDAADQNMRIYTVSVGFGADRGLMQQIADIGEGQEFFAAGAPETYTAQLQEIFRTIGGFRQAVLIN